MSASSTDRRGRLAVKEEHVRLDALRVEDAGRETQDRVQVALGQQPAAVVSPAPASNSTLSGSTTAARPPILSIVLMCCRKLSCLFDVDAQKSSRTTTRSSRSASPASLIIVIDDFRPNGGFAAIRSTRTPGSARSASATVTRLLPLAVPIPCSRRFMAHRRAVPSTISHPCTISSRRNRRSSASMPVMWWPTIHSCAASKNPRSRTQGRRSSPPASAAGRPSSPEPMVSG